ncbi:hypothetical protein B7494_g4063 [Chlorociboria aeruginascens]|nr:hypothetical protein B7494_g4063 [Chlorociboria aeruginascens]
MPSCLQISRLGRAFLQKSPSFAKPTTGTNVESVILRRQLSSKWGQFPSASPIPEWAEDIRISKEPSILNLSSLEIVEPNAEDIGHDEPRPHQPSSAKEACFVEQSSLPKLHEQVVEIDNGTPEHTLRTSQELSIRKVDYYYSRNLLSMLISEKASNKFFKPRGMSLKYSSIKPPSIEDIKRTGSTGSGALIKSLDLETKAERDSYWEHILGGVAVPWSLPDILHHYLYRSENPDAVQSEIERAFNYEATKNLRRRGLTWDDVRQWAWVVSEKDPNEMSQRFLSLSCKKPAFLLVVILHQDGFRLRPLKSILMYAWSKIIEQPPSDTNALADAEIDVSTIGANAQIDTSMTQLGSDPVSQGPLHLNAWSFFAFLSRVLYQARRIWPPAMISGIQMLVKAISTGPTILDAVTHRQYCQLFNDLLNALAIPATTAPFKSMDYNWKAQRILLGLFEKFDPPLIIDQDSYRGLIQVLAASNKSTREAEVASHRERSWPPWSIDQDGIDAQRSPVEDLSRSVVASFKARETGYSSSLNDHSMRILGGLETDGTPTIQTRTIIHMRGTYGFEANLWAARVRATRDIHEAWSAFNKFLAEGGYPNEAMYFAMFEKLAFEDVRLGRERAFNGLPGDGPEVLEPLTDNFSTFYRSRLKPPPFKVLYNDMVQRGIHPKGECLAFLIKHAPSISQGLEYLRDSNADPAIIATLTGYEGTIRPSSFTSLPHKVFNAYIALLCRLCQRTFKPSSDITHGVESPDREHSRQIISPPMPGPPGLTALRQAMRLVIGTRPLSRAPWYSIFRALARPGTIVNPNIMNDPAQDIEAWRLLVAVLNSFTGLGLELEPDGFKILCLGAEKAMEALHNIANIVEPSIPDIIQLVKDEFVKISEEAGVPELLPPHLHPIHGVHLYAYVRVLGIAEDYEEIFSVLKWMVKHEQALQTIAAQSRNGPNLIRQALLTIRVFCIQADYAAEVKKLVESVKWWDGLLEEYETQEYIDMDTWTGGIADEEPPIENFVTDPGPNPDALDELGESVQAM